MTKRKKWLLVGGLAGIVVGLVLAGGSASVVEATNTDDFCLGCHEMSWPDESRRELAHWQNASGVRAGCGDCHIPHHPWYAMLWYKTKAGARDVSAHLLGKLDSREDYREHRPEMAQDVWAWLERTDSATCRSCHGFDAMALEAQSPAARAVHGRAREQDRTCIACHKGIGHGIEPGGGSAALARSGASGTRDGGEEKSGEAGAAGATEAAPREQTATVEARAANADDAPGDAAPAGETLFDQRCGACHRRGTGGPAPGLDRLRALSRQDLDAALSDHPPVPAVSDLTAEQRRAVLTWLEQ